MATETKLTEKQRLFCEEYLKGLNATQAAIRAGYSENQKPPTSGYYTYALISPLTNRVFYIGKGKGGRVYHHEKNAHKPIGNAAKNAEILKCHSSGEAITHLILSKHKDEQMAYSVESLLIDEFGIDNLTNSSKAEMTARKKSDLPSIYEFETVGEWAAECLLRIKWLGGKIYFLGHHNNNIQDSVIDMFTKASKSKQAVTL